MSKIALTIKQKAFEQIVLGIKSNHINFDAEGGCACGRLEVKLNEQLYMSAYRSCRKSSSTPDNKLWHIDEFEFHTDSYESFHNAFHNDEESDFEIIDMKLNEEQEKELIELLKDITADSWGEEYR